MQPGDRLLTQLRPLTVTRAGDSLAATKCRELGVADSSACRASLKKAEGGGDVRVKRVRPPGSPRELITADAPWYGPRHPQVHARLPASPTHNAPPGLGSDQEGNNHPPFPPPPHTHLAVMQPGKTRRTTTKATVPPSSTHASSRGDTLARLSFTGFI